MRRKYCKCGCGRLLSDWRLSRCGQYVFSHDPQVRAIFQQKSLHLSGDGNPAKRPEVRQKLSANNAMKRPEIAKRSADAQRALGTLGLHHSQRIEVQHKISATIHDRYPEGTNGKSSQRIDVRKKLSESAKLAHTRSESRARHLAATRSATFRDRQSALATTRILDPANNFGKRRGTRTVYKGISMRSTWEVSLAQELDQLGIFWRYETKTFKLPRSRYTPDFYLPQLKLYLEVKPSKFVTADVKAKLRGVRNLGQSIQLITEKNWVSLLGRLA